MQLGLCTITNKDWPVADVLAAAADAEYDGVEIWGQDHVRDPGAGDDADPDLDVCRSVADRAAALDLDIPVYGSYLRPGRAGFADELAVELDVADALGADFVRVWPGEQEYGDHDPDHWDAVVADLERAGQEATARDLAITVEKHEGTVTNETEGARRLIEAVDAPAVGLNWQPLFHIGAEDLLAEAETLAPLSNNVHLQAVPERNGDQRCPLSEAYFDVPAILDRFDQVGFEGYAEVEFVDPTVDYEAAIRADREYLAEVAP